MFDAMIQFPSLLWFNVALIRPIPDLNSAISAGSFFKSVSWSNCLRLLGNFKPAFYGSGKIASASTPSLTSLSLGK